MTMIKRAELVIHGDVQGVGFRGFTRRHAELLGVKGWVRNRPDGTVEAMIEASPAAVDRMIDILRTGPRFSTVDRLETVLEESDENARFSEFSVKF
ncbi:MAG: acylphosphatase [Candidatus Ozemobacteraceae bacterium]